MHRHRLSISILAFVGLLITLPFQACSGIDFSSSQNESQEQDKRGGEGFDGKPYSSYGLCQNQDIGISETIRVAADFNSASVTRENCQDLAAPRPMPVSDLNFSLRDASVFAKSGKVFDEQVGSGAQRITRSFCTSTVSVPQVQSVIWSEIGNAGSLFGAISQSNGVASGRLQVDQPSELRYISVAGQNSQFDLNGGSLSYAIGGSAPQGAVTMSCATQPPPVARVQSVGVVASGSGTTYTFSTAASGRGNLLVTGLSIFRTGSQCTASMMDNVGNVYVSSGAYARDPNSGSTEIWYAPNSQPGGTTVTINLNGACSGARPSVYFAEFSGMALLNPLEGAPVILNSQAASTVVNAPVIATSSERSVIFSVISVQFDVLALQAGSSFLELPVVSGDGASYHISTAAGSYGPVWDQDNSGSYCGSTVAFKAAW